MPLEAVFMDSSPLSMAARRTGANAESDACQQWVTGLEAAGVTILVPEIADYETRRELVRVGLTDSVRRLDTFISAPGRYIPLTTPAMREAARLWAAVRNANLTTAAPAALDGDAILAGQVREYCLLQGIALADVVVATVNVRHIARFLQAEEWRKITPGMALPGVPVI